MISPDIIEKEISNALQKRIEFVVERKVIKSGKLILFCIKDFYCNFTLFSDTKNKNILYEVPYPFNLEADDTSITLDYTIDTFQKNNPNTLACINVFKGFRKPSKLFNKKLVLRFSL
jgi:hypothetical protein